MTMSALAKAFTSVEVKIRFMVASLSAAVIFPLATFLSNNEPATI